MDGKIINLLLLSIGDELKVTVPDFYYKLFENNYFDIYNKSGEKDGWIHCPFFKGSYCGGVNDVHTGDLEKIKIKIFYPVKIFTRFHNYIEFTPSEITRIEVTKKGKGSIIDEIIHDSIIEKYFFFN
jgi:hypothetical protein